MTPAQRHGKKPEGDEDNAADQETAIGRDRRVVVEAHPSVDLEPGLIEPAEARPGRSTSCRSLSRGSSQFGDHSHRKKPSTSTIATGKQEDQHGPAVHSPTANETPARKTIVGTEKSNAGLR